MAAEEGLLLPLREALMRWCDRELVGAVLAEERSYTAYEIAAYPRGLLSSMDRLREPTANDWMVGGRSFARLDLAWKILENDFISRMERQEFVLVGTETAPRMTESITIILAAWAGECTFDFVRGRLAVGVLRFAGVRARRPGATSDAAATEQQERPSHIGARLAGPAAPDAAGATAPAPSVTTGGVQGAQAVRRPRGGRENYGSLIMEALKDRYADCDPPLAPGLAWSVIATHIRRALEKKHPKRHASDRLPNEETIRIRLPSLYQELLTKRGVQLPNRSTEQ